MFIAEASTQKLLENVYKKLRLAVFRIQNTATKCKKYRRTANYNANQFIFDKNKITVKENA